MELEKLKQIVEAALMVAHGPLSFDRLNQLFAEDGDAAPSRDQLRTALEELENDYHHAGIELAKVGSGYRFQARAELAEWVNRLWDEKRPRYSRALLETLAIVAYRQPITRGEIENIRGVAVSTNIMRTLLEREWLRIVGHRDVPGKPAVYATTKPFLDYFNLASLGELPSLAELKDIDDINADLFADATGVEVADDDAESDDAEANIAEADDVEASAAEADDVDADDPEASAAHTRDVSPEQEPATDDAVAHEATTEAVDEPADRVDEAAVTLDDESPVDSEPTPGAAPASADEDGPDGRTASASTSDIEAKTG